jgi:hypothetical protein
MNYCALFDFAGIQDFFSDVGAYYVVATDIWSGRPLNMLSRKQLDIYRQVMSTAGWQFQ